MPGCPRLPSGQAELPRPSPLLEQGVGGPSLAPLPTGPHHTHQLSSWGRHLLLTGFGRSLRPSGIRTGILRGDEAGKLALGCQRGCGHRIRQAPHSLPLPVTLAWEGVPSLFPK